LLPIFRNGSYHQAQVVESSGTEERALWHCFHHLHRRQSRKRGRRFLHRKRFDSICRHQLRVHGSGKAPPVWSTRDGGFSDVLQKTVSCLSTPLWTPDRIRSMTNHHGNPPHRRKILRRKVRSRSRKIRCRYRRNPRRSSPPLALPRRDSETIEDGRLVHLSQLPAPCLPRGWMYPIR